MRLKPLHHAAGDTKLQHCAHRQSALQLDACRLRGHAATASTPLSAWPVNKDAQRAKRHDTKQALRPPPAHPESFDQSVDRRRPRRRQPQQRGSRADLTQQATGASSNGADDGPSTSGREHDAMTTAPLPQPRTRARGVLASTFAASSTTSMDAELEAFIWAITSTRQGSSSSSDGAGSAGDGTSSNGSSSHSPSSETAAAQRWTSHTLLAALDAALPDVEHNLRRGVTAQRERCAGAAWDDEGGARGVRRRHSGSEGGIDGGRPGHLLLPALVAPASNLHPPSSSLAWGGVAAPDVMADWLDAGCNSNRHLMGPDSSVHQELQTQYLPLQAHQQPVSRGQGPELRPAAGDASERLMGPLAAGGPVLAVLMCSAAGVAWTQPQQLQQQPCVEEWTHASSDSAVAAASYSTLDPALEWALGVLSTRVSPAEPAAGDVRLANRTFAAHVRRAGGLDVMRPAMQQYLTGASDADSSQMPSSGHEALPWQALQPLLAVVGNRLSPCSALALLQVLVRQVGRSWRQQQPGDAFSRPLPARQQQQVAATCQALFAAALRRPEQLTCATAAGLLVVMRRLQLHSPPTCALLVERLLAASGPVARGLAAAGSPAGDSSEETRRRGKRLRLALRRGDGHGAPPLRLSWVAMALSCLAQLRVPAEALPRRAVTRLFRSAVAPANRRHWTPSLAAALLVWAARLRCRPPASVLQQYMAGLVEPRAGTLRLVLLRRRQGRGGAKGPTASVEGVPVASPRAAEPGCSLLSRMRGPQLMAVLEALWRLYGTGASPQAAAMSAGVGGGSIMSPTAGPLQRFQRRVASVLMGRLHQLPRQQLCRLPLLLARLGLSSLWQPEHLQAFAIRVQQAAGRCDALDSLLLLRGLAAEVRVEAQLQVHLSGVGRITALRSYCSWQRGELADVALRRLTVLLPSLSPRFSATALHALSALWPVVDSNDAAACPAGVSAGSAEVDLQRRRAADTASERNWLLQQLDDHLAEALAAEAWRLGQAATGGGGRRVGRRSAGSGGGRGGIEMRKVEHDEVIGRLVLQVLESHVALRRRPSPQLQAALEAVVVAVAAALGTKGCMRVRAAYSDLGLIAGSRLSVALVTFG